MAVVGAPVDRPHQVGHPVPQFRREPPPRWPGPGAMDQPGRAGGLPPARQALHLPDAEPEHVRHLAIGELPRDQRLEEPRSVDFLPRHRKGLPCVHGGDAHVAVRG
jgi:hypothetical protein